MECPLSSSTCFPARTRLCSGLEDAKLTSDEVKEKVQVAAETEADESVQASHCWEVMPRGVSSSLKRGHSWPLDLVRAESQVAIGGGQDQRDF